MQVERYHEVGQPSTLPVVLVSVRLEITGSQSDDEGGTRALMG